MNRLLYPAMKVKKKYLAYLTVLAVAGSWFAMDCISGTASSSAATVAESSAGETPVHATAPVAAAAQAADMGDEPTIATRLDTLSQARKLAAGQPVDGFALPAAFKPNTSAQAANKVTRAVAEDTFRKSHKLISVMVIGRTPSAMVDDRLLKAGDQLDGWKLVSIEKNGVVFTRTTSKVILGFQADEGTVASTGDR